MIDRYDELEAAIVEVWHTNIFGIEAGSVILAAVVFLVFLFIRKLFSRIVLARLIRWSERSDNNMDDAAVRAVSRPLRLVPIVIGLFFVKEILTISGTPEEIADGILKSLVAFSLFWILHSLVEPLRGIAARLEAWLTHELMDWVIRGIRVAIVFVGAATILEIWGIQVGPILAGLGLIGVAVALGAQDLFRNLIAGILIIGERRFARGDWIQVDGIVDGLVEDIGFRSTLVRKFDKAPLYVPNAKLSDNALINYSRMSHRRIYWVIGVEYRTTVEQLRTIRDSIEDYVVGSDDFAPPSEVSTFVRVDRFSDSSIDIMVYCFTRSTKWGDWLAAKERLALEIKDIVENAGTAFAFPSRSLYIEAPETDAPEVFTPPRTSGEAAPAR